MLSGGYNAGIRFLLGSLHSIIYFHNEVQRVERNTELNENEWASCFTGTANPGGNPFHET